jgi:DNA-binding HxlR family transcriptional regulator
LYFFGDSTAASRQRLTEKVERRGAPDSPAPLLTFSKLSNVEAKSAEPQEVCPHFHAAIELIGKRWTGAIVCALTERPLRFGELASAVPGLSDRLLSQRLRELEDAGVVEREVEAGSPVRVTYSLTEKGAELRPAIAELRVWARRWVATEAD